MVVTERSEARYTTMKPPPPMPQEKGSVTPSTAAAATAASTAFPPDRRVSMPACEARTSTEATAPPVPTAVGCLVSSAAVGMAPRVGRTRTRASVRVKAERVLLVTVRLLATKPQTGAIRLGQIVSSTPLRVQSKALDARI